jgi:Domain of unknown function (DUF5680)
LAITSQTKAKRKWWRGERSSSKQVDVALLRTSPLSMIIGAIKRWVPRSYSVELIEFVSKAKLATYAALGDEASVSPLLPESKQLEYREGEFLYRDIYVGMFRFVGQEIVYQAGKVVWSMAYGGGLVPTYPKEKVPPVYEFLREALKQVPLELPLRGPQVLEKTDDLLYRCDVEGNFGAFHGVEYIREYGKPIFKLAFAGGLVS